MKQRFLLPGLLALVLLPVSRADVLNLQPVEDAFAFEDLPSSQYGGALFLRVAKNEFLKEYLSLLKFDLSAIPAGSTINSARLRLHLQHSEGFQNPVTVSVGKTGTAWSESSVNWNTRPAASGTYGSASVPYASDVWVEWDVKSLAIEWISLATMPRLGSLALTGPAEYHFRDFDSREGTNPPQLIIDYASTSAPSITGQPQSQTVAEGGPATFTVVANGAPPLSYQWFRQGLALAGRTFPLFTIPHALLADADSYSVLVTNDFGAVWSSNVTLTVNPLIFQGLANSPLGQANLTVSSNLLTASNIGTQGMDGVSIASGSAEFGVVTIDQGALAATPGGSLSVRAIGEVNSVSNSVVSSVQAVNAGGAIEYSADFSSLGAVPLMALVYNGSNLVAAVHNLTGTVARVTGAGFAARWFPYVPIEGKPWAIIGFPDGPANISLAGAQPVVGTMLAIAPDVTKLTLPDIKFNVSHLVVHTGLDFWWRDVGNYGPGGRPGDPAIREALLGAISRLEILGKGTGQIQLLEEHVGMFGSIWQAAGGTIMWPVRHGLRAAPETGITIAGFDWDWVQYVHDHLCDLAPQACGDPVPSSADVHWLNPDPSNSVTAGAFLSTGIYGSIANGANQLLASLEVRKSATNSFAITPDFSPVGSTSLRVEIWLGTTLVSATTISNNVGSPIGCWTPDGAPIPFPVHGRPGTGPDPWIASGWASNVVFALPGGGTVLGDRISFIAIDPVPHPSIKLDHFGLRFGNGLSSLQVIGLESSVPGTAFDGLGHMSIGPAALSVAGSDLVVSNTTANANYGVSIPLGDAGSGAVSLAGLSSTAPIGASLSLGSIGTINGLPNQDLGRLLATKTGSDIEFGVMLPTSGFIPPDWLGGLSALGYDSSGRLVVTVTSSNLTIKIPVSIIEANLARYGSEVLHQAPRYGFRIHLPDGTPATFPGHSAVPVSRIDIVGCVACGNPSPQPSIQDIGSVSRLDIIASGLPSFRVNQEKLGLFGQLHEAIGQAQLVATRDHLHLQNLVSDANAPDGLRIPINTSPRSDGLTTEPATFITYWQPLDPWLVAPAGAMVQIGARGLVNHVDQELGTGTVTSQGLTKEISADFTSFGAQSRRVEIYSNNILVFSSSPGGAAGAICHVGDWPIGGGTLLYPLPGAGTNTPIALVWHFGSPTLGLTDTQFEINNQFVKGDEIRILPEHPYPQDLLSSISLQAAGLSELDLAAESGEFPGPIMLRTQRVDDALAISWAPAGARQILQAADSVSGPWIDVPGATASPHVTTPVGANRFFRVRQFQP